MRLIDVLRGSKEIKRLIVKRSFEYNIPLRYICNELEIDYTLFMRGYVNSNSMADCSLEEEDFSKIFEMLGITIKYQFIIDKEYDGLEVRNKLVQKYG